MLVLLSVLATVLAPTWGHALVEPFAAPTNASEIWAVLVAGSNEWMNYRHQADVCHAYQILHAHGIPDDHIIVMMMDDIANNTMNPTKGEIINRPGGPDVYKGVPKDYIGAAVTPQNFLQIITGNATGLDKVGSGKVLKSGPNDHVFINLVDHGAPGIFGFPFIRPTPGHHPEPNFLKARDFIGAIETMNRTSMYKEMVIYLESCESGSMFKKILPKHIGVYAVTASNSSEPSWACYFDKHRKTMLGDVFSIKWMEDTDRNNVTAETLHHQFEKVKRETTTSPVTQFGDIKNISSEFLSLFMGNQPTDLEDSWGPFPPHHDPCLKSAVVSDEVPFALMEGGLAEAAASNNEVDVEYWKNEITHAQRNRIWMNDVMLNIVHTMMQYNSANDAQMNPAIMSEPIEIENWDCYEANIQVLNDECFDIALNPHALRYMQTLVNLCEAGYTSDKFVDAALAVCTHPPVYGIV
ncbi:unnamed protein product [Meganyctiphanes norvegica]|uniref:legumain n=1 Tax=Meganyctiphanes norvegica TaxID=48144 RepID=A0AAV2PQ24_MEGNR